MLIVIPDQMIEVRWSACNKQYYVDKGYRFTQFRDTFYVLICDLNPYSHALVDAQCDYCGVINSINMKGYTRNIEHNNGKYACHKCSVQIRHNKTLDDRRDKYYKRLVEKCSENNYTLMSSVDDITGNTSYIEYFCPAHGKQRMRIANFLSGKKCPQCAKDKARSNYQLTQEEVLARVSECGGKIINPTEYVNTQMNNLLFECSECGNIFSSSLAHFIQHGGRLCDNCSSSESLGEKKIKNYLKSQNIEFYQEKEFEDCRDIKPLPFDFYLPSYNAIIEFDGRQHFEETNFFGYSYAKTKEHDNIKNAYCEKNNIALLRISYRDINHIEDRINEFIHIKI